MSSANKRSLYDRLNEKEIARELEWSGSEVVMSDSEEDSYYSELTSEADSDLDHEEVDEMASSWLEADATDTSDEEEIRNTVGNIPLEWYDEFNHIGYDSEGRKIPKQPSANRDELDEFLSKSDNPDYWRTVRDDTTGREVVLTDEQIEMIQKLQKSAYPEADHYEDYVEHFTSEKEILPLSRVPKPKSSFIPSKWEHQKIVKLVNAIRRGWIKPRPPGPSKPSFYQLWGDGDEAGQDKHRMYIPTPRMKLPGHGESYNPPPEYLPTQQEMEEWLAEDETEHSTNYLPQKYNSLREVPGYPLFIKERFERCLDIYLCPRQRKMRVQVDPEDLIPKLPKLRDLHPFPTTEAMVYEGHSGIVQCISVEIEGQWLASGGSDCSVKLWEVATGRCVRTLHLPSKPVGVAFSPNAKHSLLVVAVGERVLLVNSNVGDHLLVKQSDTLLHQLPLTSSTDTSPQDIEWGREEDYVYIQHSKPVCQVCWHSGADYIATVTSDASGSSVILHQLSKARSQKPFKKLKGRVQKVMFHPFKPFFFIATQTCVRIYDLVRQELVKRLQSGVKWISSMAIHPSGDHLIIGSCDRKLCWFDLDLSAKPYKILRQHRQAIRSVCFHSVFPLLASSSDDGSIVVSHGKVFNDLLQNPQIIPVKMLRGSGCVGGLGVLDCVFHPSQPWIFTAGADSTVRLYSN